MLAPPNADAGCCCRLLCPNAELVDAGVDPNPPPEPNAELVEATGVELDPKPPPEPKADPVDGTAVEPNPPPEPKADVDPPKALTVVAGFAPKADVPLPPAPKADELPPPPKAPNPELDVVDGPAALLESAENALLVGTADELAPPPDENAPNP